MPLQQSDLFATELTSGLIPAVAPFKSQLLKWVGNKQRQAAAIIAHFPARYGVYYEPFLGSGGVLGVLSPQQAVGSDAFAPLMEIWAALGTQPQQLKSWYAERRALVDIRGKERAYAEVLESFNRRPNGPDLLFLCRACYGGVVRFRKADGFMSTPCGVHEAISADSFSARVDTWAARVKGVHFLRADFEDILDAARPGNLVYCDPPYSDSQSILYGAQAFSLPRLLNAIERCKTRGVYVALSIDGSKYSGTKLCELPIPKGLFEQERFIGVGRSMLKRFQMDGRSLENHLVSDRLLLTY